jgi:hypothetical protein
MSGRIQSFKKAKHRSRVKRAGSQLNPHRQRALADKRRRAQARAAKAEERARKAAYPVAS